MIADSVLKDRQADASLMALRSPIPVRRARVLARRACLDLVTWMRHGNARTVPDGKRIRLGGPARLRDGLEAFRPHPWAAAVVLRDHLGDGP